MSRTDLFRTIHKTIRRELFRGLESVSRTDFEDLAEASTTLAELRFLFGLLDEHAEHEDHAIFPSLRRCAPELDAELRNEHSHLHGAQSELERLLERLSVAGPTQRASLGRRLQERLTLFVAEQLRHTLREETEVNRVLWAHYDDEALLAVVQRIHASVPADRMAQWMERMLPALNGPERAELVGGMQRELSPEDFESVLGPARAALGQTAWERALSQPA